MTEEIKQLLIDCANFIQPYDDGGNEAERLMIRLDKALEQGQKLPIHSVVGQSEQCCEPISEGFYLGTSCPKCKQLFRQSLK